MKRLKKLIIIPLTVILLAALALLSGCSNDKYTVTFDSNGGSEVEAQAVKGSSKLNEPTAPTREGYHLTGWYAGDEKWEFGSSKLTSDITLTARWEKHSYGIANSCTECGVKWEYTEDLFYELNLDEESYRVAEIGLATSPDIVIPYYYDGKPVNCIDGAAFSNIDWIKSVKIPDSVTVIQGMAFHGCSGITEIRLPDGITEIGVSTFGYCDSLKSVYIPDTVTTIGGYAFDGCKSLESIDIPENVTSIGDSAFSGCEALAGIKLPRGINKIGNGTFQFCKSLTEIVIPNGVTSIGYSAFNYCTSLKNVTLPNDLSEIGSSAFAHCSKLEAIVFPDQLYEIGSQAFYECDSLTGVEIRGSIDPNVFEGCDSLISVSFSSSGYNLSAYAFKGCASLKTVTLSKSVQFIGEAPFYGCTALEEIIVPEDNPKFQAIDGNLYSRDGKWLYQYALGKKDTSFEIPEGVSRIANYAFAQCCSIAEITIPDTLYTIENQTFYNCPRLACFKVGENTPNFKSIDGNLYSKNGDRLLQYAIGKTEKSFSIPSHVTSIAWRAFYGSENLTDVIIPATVREIGTEAFYGCNGLKNVTISNGITKIGKSAFSFCPSLEVIEIPSSVTLIDEYAFACCDSLRIVTIGTGIERIEMNAFNVCPVFSEIRYRGTQTMWDEVYKSGRLYDTPEYKLTLNYNGD